MPESKGAGTRLRRRLGSRRFLVLDRSMAPVLEPGDRLLVDPAPLREGPPRVGDIVVLRDPDDASRLLVKRVVGVDAASGGVRVRGDAAERSRDSRAFGPVPLRSLVGIAWFRYLPRDRRGPLEGPVPDEAPKG